ncbi:MAG TPA: carbohydrate kinase family protein [Terriglobia bacterium]|nr:carbohydrate kinase family protein [Terriglobia bacterium]
MNSATRFDVTVVGELNLDLILYGLPDQLSPEKEILASGVTLTLGSSSAIFAHNLATLGNRVGFVSRIGDDPLGQISLDRLGGSGVDVSKVKRVSGPTTTGLTVILPRSQFRNILTYPGTMFEMSFADLDLDFLADSRHFHLSSFFLHRALRPRTDDLFREMKSAGLTTSLDINDDPEDRWNSGLWDVLRYVDVFFLNERELKKVVGKEDLRSAIDRISEAVPLTVVKLGANGALLRQKDRELRDGALPVQVVDLVGAGDSFDAGFLHQFIRGVDPERCLEYANLAGAFSTTRPGGTEAFRDRKHLESFFDQHWRSGVTT